MKTFTVEQKAAFQKVGHRLLAVGLIEQYVFHPEYYDDSHCYVTDQKLTFSPDAYQFTLDDIDVYVSLGDKNIMVETLLQGENLRDPIEVVIDSDWPALILERVIARAVMSQIGHVMDQSFENDWSGLTSNELEEM